MSALQEILAQWHKTPPEWMPFICLLTGKVVRKPMITRLVESLVLGIVSAGLMLYVGHQVLQNEVSNIKQAITRMERNVERLDDRFARVEDCIRLRTCTK